MAGNNSLFHDMLVELTLLPSVDEWGEGVDGDPWEGVDDSGEGLDGNCEMDAGAESGEGVEGDSGDGVGSEGWLGESAAVSSVKLAVNVDTATGVGVKVASPLDSSSIPVSSLSVGGERVCSSGGG